MIRRLRSQASAHTRVGDPAARRSGLTEGQVGFTRPASVARSIELAERPSARGAQVRFHNLLDRARSRAALPDPAKSHIASNIQLRRGVIFGPRKRLGLDATPWDPIVGFFVG